jgi:hypothetical protein
VETLGGVQNKNKNTMAIRKKSTEMGTAQFLFLWILGGSVFALGSLLCYDQFVGKTLTHTIREFDNFAVNVIGDEIKNCKNPHYTFFKFQFWDDKSPECKQRYEMLNGTLSSNQTFDSQFNFSVAREKFDQQFYFHSEEQINERVLGCAYISVTETNSSTIQILRFSQCFGNPGPKRLLFSEYTDAIYI